MEIDDCRCFFAKYYPPPTGWYALFEDDPAKLLTRLNEFFLAHQHADTWEQGMFGDHFTVVTESLLRVGDAFVDEKRQVLEIVAKAMEEGKAGR